MFRGVVYVRRWIYQGKKRKAWAIDYRVDGGKRIRKTVADTREGAQAELDRLRDDHLHRRLGVAEGKTLADLAPPFLAHKESQGRAVELIRLRVERNLLRHFGRMALEEIGAEAIDGYIKKRKEEGVENATVNRDLAVLRHMLRLAVRKWKWLRQEPYIEMLPENGPRELELTEEEEARLKPVCSPAFWALVQGAIFTGMRQGELIGLTWAQVDLAGRALDFAPTKRGKKRLVPIAEPLYYVLARLRHERSAAGGPATADRVFLRESGRPWKKDAVQARLAGALKAAEIETPLRFHDLRHTCSSRLKRLGVDEMEIQELLGHKSLKTTRGYIHIRTEQLRRAVNLLAPGTRMTQETDPELTPAHNLL